VQRKPYGIFSEQLVDSIHPKRRSGSYWKVCEARTALRSCAAKQGINQNLYYRWSKEFLEAGKKRLAGDTAREANTEDVKNLRSEAAQLKEALAETLLENRLLKKSTYGAGGDDT
jgi:transposase-like protein